MASFARKTVTFKGDNLDTLMKPPCQTLEYDKDAPANTICKPVAKSPGPKLTSSSRAWVPRRLREKQAQAAAAEEKKTKPKKKVSFCSFVKKHDGMAPEREHYDQFMGRVVEKGMPVVDALKLVPEQFKDAVKAQALDFMQRYNKAWRKNPTGIKGREMKTRNNGYGGFTTSEVAVYHGVPTLSIGGGIGLKVQTRPGHLQYVKTIREWGHPVLIQRTWRKHAARKGTKMPDDAALLRRKHENARLRREHQEGFDIIRAIKERHGIPKDQQCLRFTGSNGSTSFTLSLA